ncbi:hypothetical protein AB1N83_006594 [Pleurotus pulmonarius]
MFVLYKCQHYELELLSRQTTDLEAFAEPPRLASPLGSTKTLSVTRHGQESLHDNKANAVGESIQILWLPHPQGCTMWASGA